MGPKSHPILVRPANQTKTSTKQNLVYLWSNHMCLSSVHAIQVDPANRDKARVITCPFPALLCSNYWIQPIYQELLHSSSRYNATRAGERNRPSSGLARVAAHPRPPKKRKPSASGTKVCDSIGGICYADTLQVWFPAHWAPVVLQQLQHKEDSYRAAHPSWMDQAEAPADIRKQWQEAMPLPWDGAVADYIGWGPMVYEHSPIRLEVSAFHKSLCSAKHRQEW